MDEEEIALVLKQHVAYGLQLQGLLRLKRAHQARREQCVFPGVNPAQVYAEKERYE